MALTFNILNRATMRGSRLHTVEVTFDNSYTTNGLAVTANNLGLNTIVTVMTGYTGVQGTNTYGYIGSWDRTNSKLIALYGDNNNAADGPLIEVPNATDLSLVKVLLMAIGT